MFKILIDTCVWLDLAKDYQQQPILMTLEELIQQGEVELILPRTVIDEFYRNKARIVQENSKSISSTIKRVKAVVDKFGDPQQKQIVLSNLNDVDQRLPSISESVEDTISRLEMIFSNTPIIEISDSVKISAAQRAIDERAPFHRQRNGINDAILIEVYAEIVKAKNKTRCKYAFISHNTKDFSRPSDSNILPHPDIADYFSNTSFYFIKLSDALRSINPDLFDDSISDLEWVETPRKFSEIIEAIETLFDKVWYNRHQFLKEQINEGIVKIVDKETFPINDHKTRPIQRDIWEGALKAAAKVESRYGLENLGPWDDFEWGMINGKLSALRWVIGDEWDILDT